MPTPTTAKWPKPRNEDEFEDIVVDFLRIRWSDPHATRNGRRGQLQHGVDIIGHPMWLSGKTAGAQCKNTEVITLDLIIAEVNKAKQFPGELGEFLIVTSADRDRALQALVREHFKRAPAPFHIEVIFWPDIIADLASEPKIIEKHWKGFLKITPRSEHFLPLRWMDREHVRDDEGAEWQMQTILYASPQGMDLDISEAIAALLELASENNLDPVTKVLLGKKGLSTIESQLWKYHQRPYRNVAQKWELEVGNRGVLIWRCGEFRDGATRLYNTDHLINGIVIPMIVYRQVIERAVTNTGAVLPSAFSARVAAQASGPIVLHDQLGLVRHGMLSSPESAPEWQAELEFDAATETLASAMRLLNRVLGKFHNKSGFSSQMQIQQETLLKYLGGKPSSNGLDLFGAKKL